MNPGDDPLAELRPLHLPADIGWWPPAPGWWLVTLLLIALVTWAVIAWRRAAQRREALRILRHVEASDLSGPLLAQQINVLLRRYAMACFAQDNPQALAGQSWLEFLARHDAPGRDLPVVIEQNIGRALTNGAFTETADVDREQLIVFARRWIKRNRKANRSAKSVTNSDATPIQGLPS